MALHLTPDMLEAAYEFLRTTPPFCRWKLPHADEIKFVVTRDPMSRGYHIRHGDGSDTIAVSVRWVGHTATVLAVMAHEMIHLQQHIKGSWTRKVMHNAEFMRLADRVCRHHGFDRQVF